MYNLNVFEKYANEVIPDKNIVYANAIQDIRIEGVIKRHLSKFGCYLEHLVLGITVLF